jgi:flagellar hook-associated protein 2
MDTDTIIKELVSAQKIKNKKTSDKLTLSEWQEEKWKDLNTKLNKLYKTDLADVWKQGSYLTKAVTSSNDNLVTATGDKNAAEGAHTISIDQLASAQYITGGKLGDTVTTKTKLSELGVTSSSGKNMIIAIKNGTIERNLIVQSDTTLGDLINTCNDAGLTASYDTAQKRLFINSKQSGAAQAFSITSGEISQTATDAFNNINALVNYKKIGAADRGAVSDALNRLKGLTDAELNDLNTKAANKTAGADAAEQSKINAVATLRKYTIQKAESDYKASTIKQVKDTTVTNDILSVYNSNPSLVTDTDKKNQAVYDDLKAKIQAKVNAGKASIPSGKTIDDLVHMSYDIMVDADKASYFSELVDAKYLSNPAYQSTADSNYNAGIDAYRNDKLTGTNGLLDNIKSYSQNAGVSPGMGNLTKLGLDEISGNNDVAATVPTAVTVVKALDSEITLDGAKITGTSNVIKVAGLTITAKGKTAPGQSITLNAANNVDANYDMVKKFIKSYNDILKQMNDLYYAGTAKGYNPLSDDEKAAMTDDQIEKWENKIKDSILRRDSTLGSLTNVMKMSMMSTVSIDGKNYSLASFGIQTSTDYTEKGLLHIYGDKDDATYGDKNDKLKKAFQDDPDTTMKALTGIFKNLYDTMADKMKAIPNVRSTLTFYDDKLIDKQQTDYKSKIKIQEKKLTEMENKYYKQFSAMETAMAKLKSQSSALAGLLGSSGN